MSQAVSLDTELNRHPSLRPFFPLSAPVCEKTGFRVDGIYTNFSSENKIENLAKCMEHGEVIIYFLISLVFFVVNNEKFKLQNFDVFFWGM